MPAVFSATSAKLNTKQGLNQALEHTEVTLPMPAETADSRISLMFWEKLKRNSYTWSHYKSELLQHGAL